MIEARVFLDCMCVRVRECSLFFFLQGYGYVCVHVCVRVRVCMRVYLRVCVCVYVCVRFRR